MVTDEGTDEHDWGRWDSRAAMRPRNVLQVE